MSPGELSPGVDKKPKLSVGTCKPDEFAQVVWLHNGSEVTYNGPRTGVSLIIDKSEV